MVYLVHGQWSGESVLITIDRLKSEGWGKSGGKGLEDIRSNSGQDGGSWEQRVIYFGRKAAEGFDESR